MFLASEWFYNPVTHHKLVKIVKLLALFLVLSVVIGSNAKGVDLLIDPVEYMVTPSIDEIKAGDTINVFVKIKVRDGGFDENLTTVLLVNDERMAYRNITGPVLDNQTSSIWYSVILPAGNHTFMVLVDPDNEIHELSESNNDLTFDVHVKVWNNTTDEPQTNPIGDREESPFEYLPYVMIALIIVVVVLAGLVIYLIEKKRRADEEEMERLYNR